MKTTITHETPPPPAWVTTEQGRWMWYHDYAWRCDAERATHADYRRMLLRQAARYVDVLRNG